MKELRPHPVPNSAPITFVSSRSSRVRLRAVTAQDRPEWMALWTPGWQPRPLTVSEARSFMARRAVQD